jgi:hypothetical protein
MAATCRIGPEGDAMAAVDASLRLRKIDRQQIVNAFAMLSGIVVNRALSSPLPEISS